MDPQESRSLRYVACVSYPRSGHHVTVTILTRYFGHAFRYCGYYRDEHGDCCGNVPCTHPAVSFTKNHDFDLSHSRRRGIPKCDGVPYLIMIRNFLEAAVSDYSLFLRTHDDSFEVWKDFAKRKAEFYRRFVHKWILQPDGVEKLVIRYEDLTASPLETFSQIISFFHPPQPLNRTRLQGLITEVASEVSTPQATRMIQGQGVRARRQIQDFHHYDARFFGQLERELSKEFSRLGYDRRYAA